MDIEEQNQEIDEEPTPENKEIMARLGECREACLNGAMHSIERGGDHASLDHIGWLLDCADICMITPNFVIRDSEYAGDILSITSFICEDCAESCDNFPDDALMAECAEVCRSCANVCKNAVTIEMEEDEGEEETEEVEEAEQEAEEMELGELEEAEEEK